jgi:hypothetical protein
MPKLDPTFDAGDIIRIYLRHLTESEQNVVQCFFLVALDGVSKNEDRAINTLLRFLEEALGRSRLRFLVPFLFPLSNNFINEIQCRQALKQIRPLTRRRRR